jgi:hypothetical protein
MTRPNPYFEHFLNFCYKKITQNYFLPVPPLAQESSIFPRVLIPFCGECETKICAFMISFNLFITPLGSHYHIFIVQTMPRKF